MEDCHSSESGYSGSQLSETVSINSSISLEMNDGSTKLSGTSLEEHLGDLDGNKWRNLVVVVKSLSSLWLLPNL